MKVIVAILIAAVSAVVVWGYYLGNIGTGSVLILKEAVEVTEEEITLTGVRLVEKKDNKKIMELVAERSTIALDETTTRLERFTLLSHSDERDDVTVTAEEGLMVNATHDVTASGNVLVRDSSGRALVTDNLRWINAEKKMVTDDVVWIFGSNFVINGRGMVARADEETVELLNDVNLTLRPRAN